MRRAVTAVTTLGLAAALAGCDQFKPKPMGGPAAVAVRGGDGGALEAAPKDLPRPPEAVDAPKDLPAVHNGTDLSKEDADDLAGLARAAAEDNDYKTALAAQFWAVKKGGDGLYDLACY